MKTNFKWAVVLAIVHLVLALLYARSTPFETPGVLMNQRDANGPIKVIDVGAPDELQHVVYVRRLASGGGFPVLDPKDPDLGRNYQSHQPPLYYLLAAGWSKVFGDSAMGLRSLNAVIGGITVVGVFFLALWTTKKEPVAFGAAAFAALLPMQLALSGAVSNDPLLFCLCTWTLALASLYLRDGLCVKRAVFLGAILGLACLTKTTAIALFPALLVGYMGTKGRPYFGRVGIVVGTSLLVAGFWWIRNQQLYGDPLAMGVFSAAFQGSPKASIFIEGFGPIIYWLDWVGWWTLRSFIGAFGYMDVFLNENLYRIGFFVFVLIALMGVAATRREDEADNKGLHFMNSAFFAAIALLFVMFNLTYFQGQARYILPAIGPISVAMGLGLSGLVNGRPFAGAGAIAAALLTLNAYVLTRLPAEFELRTNQTKAAPEASN